MRRPAIWKLLLLLAAFAALTYWAAQTVDWSQLLKELAAASPFDIAVMLVGWIAVLCLRPLRMLFLLRATSREISSEYGPVWAAHIVGMGTNSVTPMRGGDVVMALIMNRRLPVSVPQALSVIIVDRACDTATVVAIFLGALVFLPSATAWSSHAALVLLAGLVLGIAAVAVMVKVREPLLAFLGDRLARYRFGVRLHTMARDLLSGLGTLQDLRLALIVFLLSVALWGATVAAYWFGLHAVWHGGSVAAAAFASAVVALTFVVPLAPGGIGVFQAAAVFALTAFGIPVEPALAFAIISHALQLVTVLVLAALALRGLAMFPARVAAPGAGEPGTPGLASRIP